MISYQLSLLNFISGITPPDPRKDLTGCKAAQKHWKTEGGYTAELRPGNVIEIKESRCRICGMRLVRIGANKRKPILDDNFGKHEFVIKRKRCKRCGEKTPDLSGWVEKGHVFQESFKRKARQLHAQGFNVAQIKKSFSVCNNIEVSRSMIQEWIEKPATQLRELHESTKLPTSGHVHNDETFPKIRGVQHYLQMTVDAVYGLVLGTTTESENTKAVTKRHLRQVEKTHKFKISTVTSDGTKKFGKMFSERSFKKATRNPCKTHEKWNARKMLCTVAGVHKGPNSRIPEPYNSVYWRICHVLDSHDETDLYIKLERLRMLVERLENKELSAYFKKLESMSDKIITWQKNPFIPQTNNRCESMNMLPQYNQSFKKKCRSDLSVQRVADYTFFRFNEKKLQTLQEALDAKEARFKQSKAENPRDPSLKHAGIHFYHERRKLSAAIEQYQAFDDKYLSLIPPESMLSPWIWNT